MSKNLSTALLMLGAVVCLAAPSGAAVRSIDLGLAINKRPAIDEGQVAWQGWDGAAWQICFFDGSQAFQLTWGPYNQKKPRLRKGRIAWQGYDGHFWQIFYFDGTRVYQLTNSGIGSQKNPRLDDEGNVVWEGWDGKHWQIYLYDGYATSRISAETSWKDDRDCRHPVISQGQVAWLKLEAWCPIHHNRLLDEKGICLDCYDIWELDKNRNKTKYYIYPNSDYPKAVPRWHVYFYDGSGAPPLRITKIVSVQTPYGQTWNLTQGAANVDIDAGQIVWQGQDHRLVNTSGEITYKCTSIYRYNVADSTYACLSASKGVVSDMLIVYDDRRPSISGGKVVWESKRSGKDICYHSGDRGIFWTLSAGANLHPVIRNGRACWERYQDGVWTILRKDGSDIYGGKTYYVTMGVGKARGPQIDSWGRIAWREFENGRWVIKLFDGTMPMGMGVTNQNNQDQGDETAPRIHGGKIVWQFKPLRTSDAPQTAQIYLWDGTQAKALTDDNFFNSSPDIYGDTVCFLKEKAKRPTDPGIQQVFVWRDGQAIPITDSSPVKQNPQIYDDLVVWQQYVGNDQGIYSCPAPRIEHITDSTADHQGLQFEKGTAVWAVGTGDQREIEFWDGLDIIPVTANGYEDRNPQLKNGRIVWEGRSNGYWQIFFYPGTGSPVQLSADSLYDNINPRLDDDGRVVWQAQIDGIWQIFLYDGSSRTQLTTTPFTGLNQESPVIDGGEVAWRGEYAGPVSTTYTIYRWLNGQIDHALPTAWDCSPPQISNGWVVWTRGDGLAEQVFCWKRGSAPYNLTRASSGCNCSQVQIAGDLIVWQQSTSPPNSEWDIWYSRLSEGPGDPALVSADMADDTANDTSPVTDGKHIVWLKTEAGASKVYLSDGSNAVKVTDGTSDNVSPRISDGQLLWLTSVDGTWQVQGWLPVLTRLSDPAYNAIMPVVTSWGYAAWEGFDSVSSTWCIYHWDGLAAEVLSSAGYQASGAALDGMEAAWAESDGVTRRIIYYDGYTTRTLASDPVPPPYPPEDPGGQNEPGGPGLHQGRVVWAGYDGNDYEIYLFDGIATYQITDNAYNDCRPQIHNGQLVWEGWDSNDWEIMFWDGGVTYNVSMNNVPDHAPRLYMGQVVWQGSTGLRELVYTWKWQGRPLFEPIGPQSVEVGQLLEFEVKATDPNGDQLTITCSDWAKPYFDEDTHIFSWTPGPGDAGDAGASRTYCVVFTATDNGSPPQSTTEQVQITVGYVNSPPEFTQIGNQPGVIITQMTVRVGAELTFPVDATDPDGEQVTYSADFLPDPNAFDPDTKTFTWIPDATQAGDHVVTFIVTDSGVPPLQAFEAVTISVGDNSPPVLAQISDKLITEGQPLTFTVSATDPDPGDTLTFSCSNPPEGAYFNPDTGVFTWQPEFDQAGIYLVTFTVEDNGVPQGDDEEMITITVRDVNFAPVIEPISDPSGNSGELIQFEVRAWDPDGNELVFEDPKLTPNWPPEAQWLLISAPEHATPDNPLIRRFYWYPGYNQTGQWPITFTVNEVHDPVLENSDFLVGVPGYEYPIYDEDGNVTGIGYYGWHIEGTQPAMVPSGGDYYLQWTAPLADPTYAYQEIHTPAGLTPPGMGSQLEVNYDFNAAATESSLVGVYNATDATWVGTPSVVAGTGTWQTVYLVVTIGEQDDDGDILEVRFYGSGTVAYDNVECRLNSLSASRTVTITVNYSNSAPSLNPIGPKSVNWGQQPLTFNVHGNDPDGEPLTFSYDPLLAGAEFVQSSATDWIFTWTPTLDQVGTHLVTFRVTDTGSPPLSADRTVTITVIDNHPPVINPITPDPMQIDEGEPLQFAVSGYDPDPGQTLIWDCYDRPAGAGFNKDTQIFTWTPAYNQHGTYSGITFEAKDSAVPAMTTTQAITIIVNYVNVAPEFTQIGNEPDTIPPKIDTMVGQDLTFPVKAVDPNGEQVTYRADFLPPDANFDEATGTFSWTPKVGQDGSYEVSFTATDTGTPPQSRPRTMTIDVDSYVNREPQFTQVGTEEDVVMTEISAVVGRELKFPVKATDANAYNPDPWRPNIITYTCDGAPANAHFEQDEATGIWWFSWTPEQKGKTKSVIFWAKDNGSPAMSTPVQVDIIVSDYLPPVLDPIGNLTAFVGQPLTIVLHATDPDQPDDEPDEDWFTYSANLLALPANAWGGFNQTTHTFTWTPGLVDVGVYPGVIFSVTDGQGLRDFEEITITVTSP